jgi:hypothetical protein
VCSGTRRAGPLYQGLESVAARWTTDLGADPKLELELDPAESSEVVAVTALELPLGDRSAEVGEVEQQVIAWTVAGGTTYLGLFDINCWYQAQMPRELDPGDTACSYFSIAPLPTAGLPGPLIDLAVDINTIAKFGAAGSLVEQHFQPVSLRFQLVELLPSGWLEASHLGLHRRLLVELGRAGSLVQPTQLYQFCLHAGLCQVTLLEAPPSTLHQAGQTFEPSLLTQQCSAVLSQRSALLTVALEHSMVGTVVAAGRNF